MIRTKLYADGKKVKSDGTIALYAKIQVNGKRGTIYSGISVKLEAWNQKDQKADNSGGQKFVREVNENIRIVRELLDELRNEYNDIASIKYAFDNRAKNKIESEPRTGFFEMFDLWKNLNKNQYSEKHLNKAISVKKRLIKYNKKERLEKLKPALDYKYIDRDFCLDYMDYLIDKGYLDSAINEHFKMIKVVMKLAIKKGISVSDDIFEFKVKVYDTPQPILLWGEVLKIKDWNPPEEWPLSKQKTWELTRDRFIFRAHTGIRESDHASISEANIFETKDGHELRFVAIKTKKRGILDLHPVAYEILKKYDFTLPKQAQQTENANIKIIAEQSGVKRLHEKIWYIGNKRHHKRIPICDAISTHSARRSFARRLYGKTSESDHPRPE